MQAAAARPGTRAFQAEIPGRLAEREATHGPAAADAEGAGTRMKRGPTSLDFRRSARIGID